MQSVILISPLLNHDINFVTQVEYAHVMGIIDKRTFKFFQDNHYCSTKDYDQITDFAEQSKFYFGCFSEVVFSY